MAIYIFESADGKRIACEADGLHNVSSVFRKHELDSNSCSYTNRAYQVEHKAIACADADIFISPKTMELLT